MYRTGEKQTKYKTPSALFMQEKRKSKANMANSLSKLKAPLSPRQYLKDQVRGFRGHRNASTFLEYTSMSQARGGKNKLFTISKME